jgi:hypothetical protein
MMLREQNMANLHSNAGDYGRQLFAYVFLP